MERRNEQRRERYKIRKELQAKKAVEQKQRKLFGIKALDVGAFAAGSAATVGAFLAFRQGRLSAIKTLAKSGMPEAQRNALVSLKNSLNVVRKDKSVFTTRYHKQVRGFAEFMETKFVPKQKDMLMGKKGRAKKLAEEAFTKTHEFRSKGTMLERQAHTARKIAGFESIARMMRSNPLVMKGLKARSIFKKVKRIDAQYGTYFDFAAGTIVGSGTTVAAIRGDRD
jgi:hypothetical protein